jgi:hypothetical protein
MIFSYYTKECVIIYSIYKDCISEYKNIDYKIENEVINQNKKKEFLLQLTLNLHTKVIC